MIARAGLRAEIDSRFRELGIAELGLLETSLTWAMALLSCVMALFLCMIALLGAENSSGL